MEAAKVALAARQAVVAARPKRQVTVQDVIMKSINQIKGDADGK